MENKKNSIKVYTSGSGAELNISAPSIKQVISATNNKAQYYAEQAMKYRDEAKAHRDNAKYYSEQNSDVTFEYINNIKASLEDEISQKQNVGNYALKEELPVNVSELENDSNYVTNSQLASFVEELKLPEQQENSGRFLMTNGEDVCWASVNSFSLFDTKLSKVLQFNNFVLSSVLKRNSGVNLKPFLLLLFFTTVIAARTELLVLVLKIPCFLPQKILPGTLSKDTMKPE